MEQTLKHIYQYITISEEERNWGIYITGAGQTDVGGQTDYPLINHPAHHYFQWSNGRRLSEYQILYITSGQGVFESEVSGRQKVRSGDLFVLFPDIWHRFCPDKETGWNEYWIEFNGSLVNHYREQQVLNPEHPVIHVGMDSGMIHHYHQIFNAIEDESLAFQFTAAGIVIQMIGRIYTARKRRSSENSTIEHYVKQAKEKIQARMCESISPEGIAAEIGISYSLFRREFKRYTGFSPLQYQIELRIQKARELLSVTPLTIKETALQTGFESSNYFSRLFKKRLGISPAEFRSRNQR